MEDVLPPQGQSVFRFFNSPRPDDVELGEMTSMGHGSQHSMEENDEEEEPQLSTWGAFLLLAGITVITGVTAEFLVSFSPFDLRLWA